MTEQEALNLVLFNGKRECVFSDEYNRLPQDLGKLRYMELSFFCRQQGAKNLMEWMKSRGIYHDIERDMREGCGTIDQESRVEEICAQILKNYPLAGEPLLSEAMQERILARAQTIFDGIAKYGNTEPSSGERDVLAVAIVQHIKRRNLHEDGKSDNQFWSYIYTQFGYKPDNDKAKTQRIYNVLRAAVRGAFVQHERYWSSEEKTQQYYTSLRLHALAPVQSMESLFEILLYFYIHDLEFTYVPEDPIFKALVNCIASRWDKDTELQKEVNVRSNAMASGLKALFSDRKAFMRTYCEHIVKQIDALVRGIDALSPDSTLDSLLRQWYAKKEEALKDQVSRDRIVGLGSGRAMASVESIRLRYVLNDHKVCISIPPIRLEDKADDYPLFELFQGENRIYAHEMDVYGRLSWTTRGLLLPLDVTELDYGEPLNIEATITYNGESLLDRDSKLHRPFIVFNDGGREASSQTNAAGVYYLFAGISAHIDSGTIDPEWIDHDGQLLRLYVDGSSPVYIDGTELFVSRDRQEDVRCYPTIPKINELRGRREGGTFNVYPMAFKLDIRLPEGKQSLNYRIIVDGNLEPLTKYCEDGSQAFVLDVPNVPVKYHSIQIVELSTGRMSCNFGYAILPNVKCSLEDELIYNDGNPTTVHVHYDGCDITSREYPLDETVWVTLSAGHLDYDLEAKLPLVKGTLQEQNIFELPSAIWREKIPDTAFVKVQCPYDWNHRLYLGTTAIPQNAVDESYELGNYLKTFNRQEKTAALTLIMRNAQGAQDSRVLTKIVFDEYFAESPVSIEDGVLMWHPEGRYVGGDVGEFQLVIDVAEESRPFTYILGQKNAVVDHSFGQDYPCGDFPFRIVKKQRSLFGGGTERILYEGVLTVGTPEQRRVIGKNLYFTRALCWNIKQNSMMDMAIPGVPGCLSNLRFLGYSIPVSEDIAYPEYTSELYFFNKSSGDWRYYEGTQIDGHDCVNPVRVWIISDQMLIVASGRENTGYFDTHFTSNINTAESDAELFYLHYIEQNT